VVVAALGSQFKFEEFNMAMYESFGATGGISILDLRFKANEIAEGSKKEAKKAIFECWIEAV